MFRNYLIIGLRVLLRNKLFSAINLGGLTIGLTAAFIIIQFVKNEMGYDSWLANSERIYTVEIDYMPPGRAPKTLAKTPLELRAAMEKDYPEITEFTRFYAGVAPLKVGDLQFPEAAFMVEESFFDVFALSFVEGAVETAFGDGRAAVISRRLAEKYYPGESALGRVLVMQDSDYKITGVLAEFPGKSHLAFDVLLFNGPGALTLSLVDWTSARVYSYLTLGPNADIARMVADAPDFLDRNAVFSPESWSGFIPSEVMALGYLPLTGIHLDARGANPVSPAGSATLVYAFIAIAALILGMASINFINLSTANAGTRAKEVGLRKLAGARRGQLVFQYLAEALLLVTLAYLLALALTQVLTPFVFDWIGLDPLKTNALTPDFLALAALASIAAGVMAALYPALHLSAKSPAAAFSGHRSGTGGQVHFRHGLVLLQYTISIVLVIASGHFYLQTRHATTMDLGFNADQVVSYWGISGAPDFTAQEALVARMRAVPGVTSVTRMAQMPGGGSQNNVTLWATGGRAGEGAVDDFATIQAVGADVDFIPTLEMSLIAGRRFEPGRGVDILMTPDTDTDPESTPRSGTPAAIIINELALSALGFSDPGQALGRTYRMQDYLDTPALVRVIGVVKNAHFQTIHSELVPMLFVRAPDFFRAAVVKLNVAADEDTLARLEALWTRYVPEVPVYPSYLTEDLASQYVTEDRQTQVFSVFAALAVVMAYLGIFGLAALTVERRTKEVGIRKALGATIMDILKLFVWQFSKPVLWAALIAWPIAALGIQEWLAHFAFRIDLTPLVFLGAGAAVLVVAWLTVASHAVRVARRSLVLALRHE